MERSNTTETNLVEVEEVENMGSKIDGYRCPKCHQFSSIFDWNNAAICSGEGLIRIHEAAAEDRFACPCCCGKSSMNEILKCKGDANVVFQLFWTSRGIEEEIAEIRTAEEEEVHNAKPFHDNEEQLSLFE